MESSLFSKLPTYSDRQDQSSNGTTPVDPNILLASNQAAQSHKSKSDLEENDTEKTESSALCSAIGVSTVKSQPIVITFYLDDYFNKDLI